MDNAPLDYTAKLAELNNLDYVRPDDYELPVLGLDAPGLLNPCISRDSKRKRGMVDGSSLFLGLDHLSTCRTYMLSGKEMVKESCVDLGLSIDLHLGNQWTSDPNQIAYATAKAFEVKKPEVDLELSLSTGPAESDITTVTQGSSPRRVNLEAPSLVATFQIVDEG